MQIEYGQGDTKQVLPDLLVQLSQRLAVIATLLLVVVIGLSFKPMDSRSLTWAAVIAADAAVLFAAVSLVIAYSRTSRPLRELLGILFFTLMLAHLAVWSLVAPGQIAELLARGYDALAGWIAARFAS
jgi:hypothetical protein